MNDEFIDKAFIKNTMDTVKSKLFENDSPNVKNEMLHTTYRKQKGKVEKQLNKIDEIMKNTWL